MSPITRRQLISSALISAMAAATGWRPTFVTATPVNPLLGTRRAAATTFPSPLGAVTVTADSSLSQDFFLSAEVLVGANDDGTPATVIPVVVQGSTATSTVGSVAAVVLVDGNLSLICPDTTTPTGWTFTAVSFGVTINSVSALQTTEPATILLLVTGTDPNGNSGMYLGGLDLSGTWTEYSSGPVPSGSSNFGVPAVPLGAWQANAASTAAGTGYWYNWTVEKDSGDSDHHYWANVVYARTDGSAGYADRIEMSHDVGSSGRAPNGYVDAVLVANPDGNAAGDTDCFGFFQDQPDSGQSGTQCPVYLITNPPSPKADGPRWLPITNGTQPVLTSGLLGQPLWQPDAKDPSQVAGMLFLDPSGLLYACTCTATGSFTPYALLPASAGSVIDADWFTDGNGNVTIYSLVGQLDGNGTSNNPIFYVQSLDLTAAATNGTVSSPIPIASNLAGFYLARRGMTAETAVLVRGLDDSLQLLGRSALGAWTLDPVLQASAASQELTTYRTLLSATDTSGAPQAGIELTITPDEDVAFWQDSGSIIAPAGVGQSFTTDNSGQVTLAIPADVLHCTPFTVSWSSGASTQTLRVFPDGELHAFLQGTSGSVTAGTLLLPGNNSAGTPSLTNTEMSGSSLMAAQLPAGDGSPSGSALFTGLGSNASVASQAAGQIGAVIATGRNNGVPVAGPSFSSVRGPDGRVRTKTGHPGENLGATLGGWWDSARHDIESVYRAIADELVQITAFAITTTDQMVVTLSLAVGDFIADAVQIVVTDLRTAAIAVGGFFRHLGAEIADALRWLRMFFGGLISEINNVADLLLTCLTVTLPAAVSSGFDAMRTSVDTFFTDAQTAVNSSFTNLRSALTSANGNATIAGTSTAYATPSPTPNQAAASTIHENVKASWMLQKAGTATSAAEPPGAAKSSSALANLQNLLSGNTYTAAFQNLFPGSDTASTFTERALDDILAVVQDVVDEVLAVLDVAFDATIDVASLLLADALSTLNADLDDLPVVGPLLQLVGVNSLTIGKLVALVLAFPIVIGTKLLGIEQPLVPAGSTGGTGESTESFPLEIIQLATGFVANLYSTSLQVGADVLTANDASTPAPISWLYLGASLAGAFAQFPFEESQDPRTAWHGRTSTNTLLWNTTLPAIGWALSGMTLLMDFLTAKDPASGLVVVWGNSALALLTAIINGTDDIVGSAGGWALSMDVLANLTNFFGPLSIAPIQEPALWIPVGIKVAIDALVCGGVGGIYLAQLIIAAT